VVLIANRLAFLVRRVSRATTGPPADADTRTALPFASWRDNKVKSGNMTVPRKNEGQKSTSLWQDGIFIGMVLFSVAGLIYALVRR